MVGKQQATILTVSYNNFALMQTKITLGDWFLGLSKSLGYRSSLTRQGRVGGVGVNG